jgi:deoxycytidylate deaminase
MRGKLAQAMALRREQLSLEDLRKVLAVLLQEQSIVATKGNGYLVFLTASRID